MSKNVIKPTIIETGNRYGIMNKASLPKTWTEEKKKAVFEKNWEKAGRAYGFDSHRKFMLDQKHENENTYGNYFVFPEDYVEANPNGWTDIPHDIGIITKDAPGIVVGHPVADCPVVVMQDVIRGVTAIAHCGGAQIDRKLPMMMADALLDFCGTRDEHIAVYVGACAGESWIYKGKPNWIKDEEMWKSTGGIVYDTQKVVTEDGANDYALRTYINLRNTLRWQLQERNISMISVNWDDTITDPRYYSNHAASPDGLNQEAKAGRNFTGAFYKVKTR